MPSGPAYSAVARFSTPAALAVNRARAEKPVVVSADKNTPYGEVVSVMDLLKQAQVDKVGLLFQNEK